MLTERDRALLRDMADRGLPVTLLTVQGKSAAHMGGRIVDPKRVRRLSRERLIRVAETFDRGWQHGKVVRYELTAIGRAVAEKERPAPTRKR